MDPNRTEQEIVDHKQEELGLALIQTVKNFRHGLSKDEQAIAIEQALRVMGFRARVQE